MLPDTLAELVRAAEPLLEDADRPRLAPQGAVVLRGRGRGRKSVVLLYQDGRPLLCLKTARGPGVDDLRAEHQGLLAMCELPGLAGAVPPTYGMTQVGGCHLLVQGALPGSLLAGELRSAVRPGRVTRPALHAVRGWLQVLQTATVGTPETLRSAAVVEGLSVQLDRDGVLSPRREGALTALQRLAESVGDVDVPCSATHGDLWPGNVLRSRTGVGVIDWGHYRPQAPATDDLWFLLLTTAHVLPGSRRSWRSPEQAFATAFLEDGWYGRLTAAVVREHLSWLGLPVDAAALLLLGFLLGQADHAHRLSAREPVGPAGIDWAGLVLHLLDAHAGHRGPVLLRLIGAGPRPSASTWS